MRKSPGAVTTIDAVYHITPALSYDRAKKLSNCRLLRSSLPLSDSRIRACSDAIVSFMSIRATETSVHTDEMRSGGVRAKDVPAIEGLQVTVLIVDGPVGGGQACGQLLLYLAMGLGAGPPEQNITECPTHVGWLLSTQ